MSQQSAWEPSEKGHPPASKKIIPDFCPGIICTGVVEGIVMPSSSNAVPYLIQHVREPLKSI